MPPASTQNGASSNLDTTRHYSIYLEGTFHHGIVAEWFTKDENESPVVEFRPGSTKAKAELFVDERGQLDPKHPDTMILVETDNGLVHYRPRPPRKKRSVSHLSHLEPGERGFFGFDGETTDTDDGKVYSGRGAFTWEESWHDAKGTEVMSIPFLSCWPSRPVKVLDDLTTVGQA